MADRELLLSYLPTKDLRGFEIGALMSPFLPKAGNDVTLVDRLSTEELRTKFATKPDVAVNRIAEVDVVVKDGALLEALKSRSGEEGFDYAIASHVIEHVPNVVAWLAELAELIRVGGRLLLVVPDKRYTFDYLREVSTLPDLIDAWIRDCRRPTPRQVFDFNAYAVKMSKLDAWSGKLEPSTLARYSTLRAALDLSLISYRQNTYLDSHCWVFTPARFLGLLADLAELGLLQWKSIFFADTRRDEEDFGIVLQRTASDESPAGIAAGFRAALPEAAGTQAELAAEVARLRSEIDSMRASRLWRFARPIRRIGRAVQAIRTG